MTEHTHSEAPATEYDRSGAARGSTAAERLEASHRIPLVATCVFVVTMLAIWLMGRQLGGHYTPIENGDGVEWVRSR